MKTLAQIEKVDILGVHVSAISLVEAVACMRSAIADRELTYICVTGAHGIVETLRDAGLRRIHNAAGLVTPDGIPVVWTLKALGNKNVTRVYGPDLLLSAADRMRADGTRHFFYGGAPGIAETLAARLADRFPGLEVAGTFCPPFRDLDDGEMEEICRRINDSGAQVVWIGLSTPKQEHWMARARARLDAPVLVGVGAAFDFHAGVKRQAPLWMQRNGLEWLFRTMTEPRRLGGRYLRIVPVFGTLALCHVIRKRLRI